MTKHTPPAVPEPRGVSQVLWVAACLGILIFAAVAVSVVPSFTAKIRHMTETIERDSVSREQVVPPKIAMVLHSDTEWQTNWFGKNYVGKIIKVWLVPETKFCTNAAISQMPRVNDWLNKADGFYQKVDRYGNPVPIDSYGNPQYFRILSAHTFGYLSYRDDSQCRS